jgi:hypothetical protein
MALAQPAVYLSLEPWLLLYLLLGIIVLLLIWQSIRGTHFAHQHNNTQAQERAEMLLRESLPCEEYQRLINNGYLEIRSKLYPNRVYRIPRERRRVQVYTCERRKGIPRYNKLGELCVIAYDPVPHADLILTHKWMIEADEKTYLSIANWIG